jgi:hypothetical protein
MLAGTPDRITELSQSQTPGEAAERTSELGLSLLFGGLGLREATPIWHPAMSDPFLDRMRAALDADAARRAEADNPLKREETVANGRGLKPSDPNAPVTPVEVSLSGLSQNPAIAKGQIRAFISRLLQGRTFTIRSTGTDVRITAESRGESVSKVRRVEQAAPMRDADRLIENAYFVESRTPAAGKPKAEASRAYTTFAVPVAINGELYASHFTVREPKSYPPNSGIFYEFNLGPKIVGADVAMGLDHSAPASVAPKVTVQQLIDSVKAYKARSKSLNRMRGALDADAARGHGGGLDTSHQGKGSEAANGRAHPLLTAGIRISRKVGGQAWKRGWTYDLIRNAIEYPLRTMATRDMRHLPGGGRVNEPATIYYSRRGGYVVRNDRTGDIVQVSDRTNKDWKASWE